MNTNYRSIAHDIKSLYTQMDKVNDAFSQMSGISCVSTCGGSCCKSKEVEVSPIDLLPLVIELFDSGKLDEVYAEAQNKQDEACMFYKNGKCSTYSTRATLCRLFGYASVYDKRHQLTLSVCSLIKQEQKTEVCPLIVEQAANLPNWSQKIRSLLPYWDQGTLPFNQAFLYASERFILSESYQD